MGFPAVTQQKRGVGERTACVPELPKQPLRDLCARLVRTIPPRRRGVVTFLVRSAANLSRTPLTEEVRMATLLSVEDVAAELGTPVRFVRRLIQERRIRFHKIGKYVRIATEDLAAFIADGRVDPDLMPPAFPSVRK